ncbi:DHA2 family efflux MFS transporter permease subunit [Hymenobacter sp. YC55]|uniref:DHA2 family efflux MFS transporter permease subunit n=1 Tax=Hymenobacter sp. YC55 TaxID=3034019 RepID=UPI0023F85211|nr:DHA2 family efflux MFS transporter permease subunit [Hymenobacter sp. YC55]MDF7811116.1 DHA2 family efflux MFS transporter permease subunit [Hymenobacter sp. YC55]
MSSTKTLKKPAGDATASHGGNLKWIIAVTVAMATFMEVLDDTSVSVALSQIGGNLSAAEDEVTWVVTAQLVSKAVVLPVAGFLATVVGRKRLFSICLLAYGATSLLCGLSPSIGFLVFMRVVQGLSGGMLSPMAQAILTDTFPPAQRGLAFAAYGVATVVAPTVGPTLGGYLVDNASWNWVFFVNVPVAIVTAFLVSILVKDPPAMVKEKAAKWAGGLKVDYVGLGLLAVGLSALQYVLSRGEREEWFSSGAITVLSVVAALALVAGVIWEWRSKDPVIDLKLLRHRNFAAAVLVMFAVGAVLFSSSTQLPLFLQNLLGYTAVKSGLAISPGGASVLLLMPVVGVLSGKVQARWMILFGLIISTLALFNYAHVLSSDIDFVSVAKARVYQSMGLAFLFVPISVAAYVGIAKNKTNQAATLINLAQSLGGSFGIAAITTLIARRAQFHQSRIIDSLNFSNPNYEAGVQSLASTQATVGGSLAEATERAQATIYGAVQLQANILSYIDSFYLLGFACLLSVPLVFLMRANKPGQDGQAGAAG